MDWIPAISTTSLLAICAWLGRNLIVTRLTKSVQSEYDIKLAKIKSEFTKEQELLKSDLKSKELQLESLKGLALSGLSSRQAAYFDKQVSAIEVLWSQVIDLLPAKSAAQSMAMVKFDDALKLSETEQRVRDMFESIGSHVDPSKLSTVEAHKVRPFLSPVPWAYFSAYSAIVSHAVLKMHMLKKGLNLPIVADGHYLRNLVVKALPHRKDYIEKVETGALYHLLEELESFMLLSFENTLKGKEETEAALKQASEIIKAAEKLTNSEQEQENT
ncbi:hypothetical protein ACRTC3_21450 [Photobacterium damselae]|uniref:hypothetical protein n=1 Tax=Photobacterium damselae TaxID=38293 RepID=UPI003D7D1B4A